MVWLRCDPRIASDFFHPITKSGNSCLTKEIQPILSWAYSTLSAFLRRSRHLSNCLGQNPSTRFSLATTSLPYSNIISCVEPVLLHLKSLTVTRKKIRFMAYGIDYLTCWKMWWPLSAVKLINSDVCFKFFLLLTVFCLSNASKTHLLLFLWSLFPLHYLILPRLYDRILHTVDFTRV